MLDNKIEGNPKLLLKDSQRIAVFYGLALQCHGKSKTGSENKYRKAVQHKCWLPHIYKEKTMEEYNNQKGEAYRILQRLENTLADYVAEFTQNIKQGVPIPDSTLKIYFAIKDIYLGALEHAKKTGILPKETEKPQETIEARLAPEKSDSKLQLMEYAA